LAACALAAGVVGLALEDAAAIDNIKKTRQRRK